MKQEKIDRVLQLIKNDKAQENHLFKTLATIDNPFPLLIPLKEAGYFSPEKNPAPIEVSNQKGYFTIPHWNILDYLENVATHNSKDPSNETTKILLEIINSIINYRTDTSERIDNYRTDWFLTKIIFLLPIENIITKHIEFIKTALESKWNTTLIAHEIGKSVLPSLLKNNAKSLLLKLLIILFEYKTYNNRHSDKYISIVDKYWLKEALKTNKKNIAKLCALEAADLALAKIFEIIKKDKSQFNKIWIPTIENHPQTSFPDRYECQLVHFIRDMFELSAPDEISEIIKNLLKEEHPIFKRLALHVINFYYIDLNELFWDWTHNPLNEVLVKHELYELIKNNCTSFNKPQIDVILKWIEEKDYYISDEIKDDKERVNKIIAYKKKEWFSALLNTKDKDVIDSYNEYNRINSAELDHPGFDYWSESGWGTVSPIEETDFLTKSNNEIVDYLNSFKEENGWNKPTVDGLADTLKKCVSDNPQKFIDNIKPFLGVQQVYQHALLWGFSDAWHANKEFEWKSLLLFISEILKSDTVWNEEYTDKGYHYRNWIISQTADLINDGTKSDNHAFNAELLPEAEEILLLLVQKVKSDIHGEHDIVTSVLNSVKGKIFTAMVNYSLRYARLYYKDKEERWIKTIKNDFTNRLDRNIDSSLDFSVVLGEYLPNLYYLDKEWTISNINKIFLKTDNTYWHAAFTGYLFYSSNVYSHLYKLLTQNNHYKKALNTAFEDEHSSERVAQHICVAYLNDWEKLEDNKSLISQLIKCDNIKHLSAIISFFWMQRDHLTDKIKNKIKPLWKKLYLKSKLHQEEKKYQIVISDLSKWLVLIDEIDNDVFKWLELSTKHIETNFNSSFFIEYLLKHVKKTPEKVGQLFIEMLNHGFYPDYKKEHITEIITTLNSHNQKENAIKICNLYMNNGFVFTRPILETIRE